MERVKKEMELPDLQSLRKELERTKYNNKFSTVLKSTVYALIVVAAISVLIATLWLPILRTYGHSMSPMLEDGDIVVSVKSTKLQQGDLVAFYSNNKLLIKRVIAGPGDWVVVDGSGSVYVNSERLEEPYIYEPALGNSNIEYPYQVPDSSWFVMGDHRSTSIDSRNTAVGCVYEEQVVGKIIFRVWPLQSAGSLTGQYAEQ